MTRTKKLIVTADDVGLHRGMNEGTIKAHRDGLVTACSVVANGREFEHAVELLRENQGLEVGVHLTFVEEKPLTDMTFPRKWPVFLWRSLQFNYDALAAELRAQIERVLATGLRVTHLNSHQHLHVLPRVREIVRGLASEHGIAYIRVPADRGGESRQLSMRALRMFSYAGQGNDHTIGIAEAGHLTAERIVGLLNHVEGVTELVAHPGLGDIARWYDWGYDWEGETAALCDPAVGEAVRARGIVLTTPSRI